MASRPGDDELPPDPFPGDPFARPDGPSPKNTDDARAPDQPDESTSPMSGMFAQFAQAAAAQGTFNADIARHLAVWTAAGGAVEPNLEPLVRIQVEQAGASVGPLVEELTGLLLHQPGEKLIVTAATKAEWAADSLTAWRPFFDGFAAGVGAMFDGTGLLDSDGDHDDDEMPEQLRALGLGALPGGLSGLAKMMGPTLAGMQAGTLLGQLGMSALGTYDLLVPRVAGSRLLVVASNVTAFSEAWTLPPDHALTQIVTRDLLTHAIMRQPHVGLALSALINRHASAGRVDPSGIGEIGIAGLGGGLGGLLGGAGGMGSGLGGGLGAPSPDAFLAGEPTPEQQDIRRRIRRMTIPLVAAIDYLASAIGARLLGDNRQVAEALRRRHLDRDPGTRLAEHLLGVGVDQAGLDAGRVFVGGVVQRAGHDGLSALFAEPDRFPTDAELVAPGLWLARIGLAN